jgi:hypothetical protein
MRKLVTALAVSSVAFGFVGAAFAQQPTCNDSIGCKLCSAIDPSNFRDTVTVATTWTPATCRAYAIDIAATFWQLGCMTSNAFLFGAGVPIGTTTPSLPTGNTCRW